jgi:hypothetical protein
MLQSSLDEHNAQARVDHEELLHTIHLLESMNEELGHHNFLWRSVHHSLISPDPTLPFPEFASDPIPDIADFVDRGVLAQVFQLRGVLREAEESHKVTYVGGGKREKVEREEGEERK